MDIHVLIISVLPCRTGSTHHRNGHLTKLIAKIKGQIVSTRARATVYTVKRLDFSAFSFKVDLYFLFLHYQAAFLVT